VASRKVLTLCSVVEEGVGIGLVLVPEDVTEKEGVRNLGFEEGLNLPSSASIEGRGWSASTSTFSTSFMDLAIVLRSLVVWGVKPWENPDEVVGENMFVAGTCYYVFSLDHCPYSVSYYLIPSYHR
jgi:hypothetical protein